MEGYSVSAWLLTARCRRISVNASTWGWSAAAALERPSPPVEPFYILCAPEELYNADKTAVKLTHGLGGRAVAWGILQDYTESEESDQETWTRATDRLLAGISFPNPRTVCSFNAIVTDAAGVPARGQKFTWTDARGRTVAVIALRVVWQWSNGGWHGVQVTAVKYEGF